MGLWLEDTPRDPGGLTLPFVMLHAEHIRRGNLDAHLKGFYYRDIANWIVVLLRDAGIVDVDPGPPLRLRMRR